MVVVVCGVGMSGFLCSVGLVGCVGTFPQLGYARIRVRSGVVCLRLCFLGVELLVHCGVSCFCRSVRVPLCFFRSPRWVCVSGCFPLVFFVRGCVSQGSCDCVELWVDAD